MIKSVQTERFVMDYFRFGKGKRTFVILPGVSVKSVMLSEKAVEKAYESFAEDYTVYVFDRIRDLPAGVTVGQMADDTAEAMKRLGLAGADVFGASQGGMIAQLLAARHPELVRKMVLCSTLCRKNPIALSTIEHWIDLAERGEALALNMDILEKVYCPRYQKVLKSFSAAPENLGTEEELLRFSHMAGACISFDSTGELPNVKAPTLVIGSRGDKTLLSTGTQEIAEALSCPLYLYEEYGHAVYDEAPDMKERILQFLQS